MVYLAASEPLPLLPWRADRPGFHVEALPRDHAVRAQISLPALHYAGSHQHCGCGFQLGPEFEGDDEPPEDAVQVRETLAAFADYLEHQLRQRRQIEIVACWSGAEAEPPESRRSITPDALRRPDFRFAESERVTVVARP
jgi:hypothetical protein